MGILEDGHVGIFRIYFPGCLPEIIESYRVNRYLERPLAENCTDRIGVTGMKVPFGKNQIRDTPKAPRRSTGGMKVYPIVATNVDKAREGGSLFLVIVGCIVGLNLKAILSFI